MKPTPEIILITLLAHQNAVKRTLEILYSGYEKTPENPYADGLTAGIDGCIILVRASLDMWPTAHVTSDTLLGKD